MKKAREAATKAREATPRNFYPDYRHTGRVEEQMNLKKKNMMGFNCDVSPHQGTGNNVAVPERYLERMEYVEKIRDLEMRVEELQKGKEIAEGFVPFDNILTITEELCLQSIKTCFSHFHSVPKILTYLIQESLQYSLEYVEDKLEHKRIKLAQILCLEDSADLLNTLKSLARKHNAGFLHPCDSERSQIVTGLAEHILEKIPDCDEIKNQSPIERRNIFSSLEQILNDQSFDSYALKVYELIMTLSISKEEFIPMTFASNPAPITPPQKKYILNDHIARRSEVATFC